jgi:photosystem II stability/assembly factor-like uncharacterized protein
MRSPLEFTHVVAAFALAGCIDAPTDVTARATLASTISPALTPQVSGTTNRLEAIAPVDENVAWIAGVAGTVLRTTDGGATWQLRPVPGAETLAFRDIHAVDADTAFILTNNGGPNARIYKTSDGGATWTLEFQSPIANTFYDCFAFWSPRRAIAIPDAENGHFDTVRMTDGHTWANIGDQFPPGQPGEGLFPTSGNCVTTLGRRRAWAVLGGADPSRVLVTDDGGDTWTSHPIPITGAPTSGGTNVIFRDRRHGIVAGGDVFAPTVQQNNVARSSDGGETWTLATPAPFPGAVYGLAYVPRGEPDDRDDLGDGDDRGDDHNCRERADHPVIATGPGGAAWSRDEGDTWEALPGLTTYFTVELATRRTGWLAGSLGKIVRIDF